MSEGPKGLFQLLISCSPSKQTLWSSVFPPIKANARLSSPLGYPEANRVTVLRKCFENHISVDTLKLVSNDNLKRVSKLSGSMCLKLYQI